MKDMTTQLKKVEKKHTKMKGITYFSPIFPFDNPRKYQKTEGGIKWEH